MDPWIIYSQPRPAASFRLFAFPHAGGGAAGVRGWADRLTGEVELGYVQLPGRESRFREMVFSSIPDLIPVLVDAMLPHLDRPFAFYGHSLGGKIAFETARELRRRRESRPAHLFVAACPAPQLPWTLPLVHELSTPEFVRVIQSRYGGIPQQILEDADLCALLLPVLRADVRMIETYSYQEEAPLDTDITAFGGFEDRMVAETALAQWRAQTSGAFYLKMAAGDHFFPRSPESGLPEFISSALSRFGKAGYRA